MCMCAAISAACSLIFQSYEERSLGIFELEEANESDEPVGEGPRGAVWGRYLAWHARKQLAFGECFGVYS